jgi:hypothetical protein
MRMSPGIIIAQDAKVATTTAPEVVEVLAARRGGSGAAQPECVPQGGVR